MRYRVSHTTEYLYDDPVSLCHNLLRLRPRDTAFQTCCRSELTISPTPTSRRDLTDTYGNHATWLSIEEPHTTLLVRSISEVEVSAPTVPTAFCQFHRPVTVAEARSLLARAASCGPDLVAASEFRFDSPLISAPPAPSDFADYAAPSFHDDAPLADCLLDLTTRIFTDFTFDPRATTVGTPPLTVLKQRRGVCQDFAHLQIACCRSLGLAARYVSGYVLTRPPEGKPRLVGSDASHAWVSVYVPDHGWLDLDPTNGIPCAEEHITIGFGRDYDDIAPLKGVLIGGSRHWMKFGVDVEPIA